MNRPKNKKITRIALLVGLVLILLLLVTACSGNFTHLEYEFDPDTKTCTVIDCIGALGADIVIPETHKGFTVTAIADNAFSDTLMRSVTLPSTIQYIGTEAFSNCVFLRAVYGLEECSSLKEIKSNTFYRCIALETIELPQNLTSIEQFAFFDCNKLESIQFPSHLEKIEWAAFQLCTSLSAVNFPDSVTYIGRCAFAQCHSIKKVTIPPYLSSNTFFIFLGCNSLENIYTPENCLNFSSIDGVLFDKNQRMLYAYPSGKTAESYTIPDTVYNIEQQSFAYNPHLKEITMPRSFNMIYRNTFENSHNISTINYNGTVKEWQSKYKKDFWDEHLTNYTVYCTDGQIAKDGTVTYK